MSCISSHMLAFHFTTRLRILLQNPPRIVYEIRNHIDREPCPDHHLFVRLTREKVRACQATDLGKCTISIWLVATTFHFGEHVRPDIQSRTGLVHVYMRTHQVGGVGCGSEVGIFILPSTFVSSLVVSPDIIELVLTGVPSIRK